ncbi:type I-F CRISPR-associated helicase Cas3f [Methyloparacoccus murrellii]
MNILLISECTKNALTETRRILDQFAERRGERTWQTAITQQGLDTLRRLLRQHARKNTAVACHWIRGKDHSELLWIVGDTRRFNERGAVPTNITRRDILRSQDENDWHSAETIRLLASLAALFHDFGKASVAFQAKLKSTKPLADAYRHEWVSLRLFEAFVSGDSDDAWLARLAQLPENASEDCLARLVRDGLHNGRPFSPFRSLRSLAQITGWLIVSHHRLPTPETLNEQRGLQALPQGIESHWCGQRLESCQQDIAACWTFDRGLPFASQHWQKHAAKVASTLQQHLARQPLPATPSPYLLHLSRLALMLADHYYSSEDSHKRYGDKVGKGKALYANTDRKTGQLKQRLDEHLIGVEVNASRIVRALPRLADQLPRLVHRGFRQRAIPAFAWQNRAWELSEGLRNRSHEQGFFGVNLASTGCGKTLANGRILYGLADPRRGARFTIALGLRTLTLQTGDAYRHRLALGDDEMAVMVGGAAVRELHEHKKAVSQGEASGSESADALVPEYSPVLFEGAIEDGPLNRWLKQSPAATTLINAPLLVCTIDHLMPACQGTRGGHQIPPMLRLMTSDLVLDEPDDFGIDDLPALSRLVHWVGLLGSRVLLSSATLPPALVEGLFEAYRAGRAEFVQHRGQSHRSAPICCAWFDEFGAEASEHGETGSYRAAHASFVGKRLTHLGNAPVRRNADILPLSITRASRERVCADLAEALQPAITRLHADNHQTDPVSGKRVSIGLIRMANIDPLVLVARSLLARGAPAGQRIHLCAYHSRHPLLVRSAIEQRLDRLLTRHDPALLFADAELRQPLDRHPEPDQIFIVLATAVAEVGRDHDYDWAIVEPSSMRSIIQIAGRIRRHRPEAYAQTNLLLLDTNIKHLVDGPGKPAFLRPGFEHLADKGFQLRRHHLSAALSPEQLARIDAASRIRERAEPHPQDNLVDLEHARLRNLMQGATEGQRQLESAVPLWWQTPAHLTGYLQKQQPFRHEPLGRQRYALLPDEDGAIRFYRIEDPFEGGMTAVDHLLHPMSITPADGISLWGDSDYASALQRLAEHMNLDPADCARRYGTLELPCKGFEEGQGIPEEWAYHHALGFSRFHE